MHRRFAETTDRNTSPIAMEIIRVPTRFFESIPNSDVFLNVFRVKVIEKPISFEVGVFVEKLQLFYGCCSIYCFDLNILNR